MRRIPLYLAAVAAMLAAPLVPAKAQDTTKPATVKKPPSKAKAIVKKLADTAATAAAGAGVQSLLGKKAGGVANALGVGGALPCGTPSAGAAIVGLAKGVAKKATDTAQPAGAVPCTQAVQVPGMPAGGIPGMPAGIPGMPGGVDAAAAAAAAAGGANPMSGMGAMAAYTPVGMAVAAAPLAGKAAKGIKGMLGGKPQDKISMLRDLGKGRLELKSVKFIEGTAELEPGYEPSLVALSEAVGLAEGTYLLYVAAEAAEKGEDPDTALARKRVEKVWAAVLVNGVADQRVIGVTVLPKELADGRKPPKRGQAKVELLRLPNQ